MSRSFHWVLILALFSAACTVQRNPVSGNKRLMAYTWTQEVQIGKEVDQELSAQYGLYDNPAIVAYIDSLGQETLSVSHMRREGTDAKFQETEFFFRVLDSPVINAFALPGGYIYVTRGLMAHLNNEAQLVVVLGHEIGHVAARHASQRALRQNLGQIAILGGAILGQEFLGLPGEALLNLSSQAAQLIFLSYSRDAERESDRLGVEYAARLGYAAEEGAAFFTSLKRMSEQSGHSIPNMLSSHPDPGERESNIPRMAREWEEKGFPQTRLNDETYLALLNGMILGDNPREGFVSDGEFIHPDLEFRFSVPRGWQLINERQQVVLVSESNDAVMLFRIDSQSESAQASVESFIAQEGIEVNQQSQASSSGRYTAWKADVNIPQRQGDLRALVYAIEHRGRVYRFINYTSDGNFGGFSDAFLATPESFNTLYNQEHLNVKPVRLNLVRVESSRPFIDFLPDPLPAGFSAEDLAIMNQLHLDDPVEAGALLKIPGH